MGGSKALGRLSCCHSCGRKFHVCHIQHVKRSRNAASAAGRIHREATNASRLPSEPDLNVQLVTRSRPLEGRCCPEKSEVT